MSSRIIGNSDAHTFIEDSSFYKNNVATIEIKKNSEKNLITRNWQIGKIRKLILRH